MAAEKRGLATRQLCNSFARCRCPTASVVVWPLNFILIRLRPSASASVCLSIQYYTPDRVGRDGRTDDRVPFDARGRRAAEGHYGPTDRTMNKRVLRTPNQAVGRPPRPAMPCHARPGRIWPLVWLTDDILISDDLAGRDQFLKDFSQLFLVLSVPSIHHA